MVKNTKTNNKTNVMEGEGGGGGETFPFKRFTFSINAFYNVAFEHTLLKHAVRREIEGKVREGGKRETETDSQRKREYTHGNVKFIAMTQSLCKLRSSISSSARSLLH